VALLNDNNYGQEDNDGDGVAHLTGANKRLTHLMYLNLGPGFATALRPASAGPQGGAGFSRVHPAPGGWRVTGPAGLTARLLDARGRAETPGRERSRESGAGGVLRAAPSRLGVCVVEVRQGARRESRRVVAP